MRNFSIKYIIFALCVIILTVVFDQLTKEWALHNLHVSRPITFFFSLTLNFNKGVSFGMFNNPETSQIILIIVALCVVFGLLWKMNSRNIICYSLISGGAIGNIIDRIRMHAVVDFLHLHYNNYHFPIFNVADIAICLGCGMLLLVEFLQSRKNQRNTKQT